VRACRWPETFGTRERAAVEAVCRPDGVAVQWRRGDALRLTNTLPATARHPVTGTELYGRNPI
jgi:hypothetical protein